MYAQQCHHIAYIIKETMARGATVVEPIRDAQDAWCAIMRDVSPDNSEYLRECTPGYFNSEGKPNAKGFLGGELYGPGFIAFDNLLEEWRENGKMAGLSLKP
jgi:cyclohexanone monooxygenase